MVWESNRFDPCFEPAEIIESWNVSRTCVSRIFRNPL